MTYFVTAPNADSDSAAHAWERREPWVLAFAWILPSLVTLVYFVLLDGQPPLLQQVVYGLAKGLQFALPVIWVQGILRKPARIGRPRWPMVAEGIAFGALVFAAMLAIHHFALLPRVEMDRAAQIVRQKVAGLDLTSPGRFVALGAFYSLFHSLLEEYYFRWFLHGRLARWLRRPWAILASSVGFTAHHVIVLAWYFGGSPALVAFFSFSIAIGGAVWAWQYERSGSLLGPWLGHLLVDAGIFTIGYGMTIGSPMS